MGFFEEIKELFGTTCFYTVFGLKKDAQDKEIKKAYHKLSLKYHPDRTTGEKNKEQNKVRFQALSKIHSVLSNSEQRAVYDETGELVDESDISTEPRDWVTYWRILFKKVSKKDIELIEKEYKGSEEEKQDIKKYYLEFEGDMNEVMDHVLCSTLDDEEQFRVFIQKCIDNEELPAFENFTNESCDKKKKRRNKALKEEQEAAAYVREMGLDTDDDLKQLLLRKNADREKQAKSFFDDLEAKYCQPKKQKTTKASVKRKRK